MSISLDEKKALSMCRLDKAESLLDDAALLLKEARWESSVNRSFYAALNAARAALILYGENPETNEDVKKMVDSKLVMEGRMPAEYGKWFRKLYFELQESEKEDCPSIEVSDAQDALENASRFIEMASEIVTRLRKKT